ncbi:MAG: hypothetical protein JST22_04125 [Bacteroidetes bacterium]|nr:hypothetical protein [Bacteroidota bacterium]
MIDASTTTVVEPEAITSIPIPKFPPDSQCRIEVESVVNETIVVSVVDANGTAVDDDKLATGETFYSKISGKSSFTQPYTLNVLTQSAMIHVCKTGYYQLPGDPMNYEVDLCQMAPLPSETTVDGQINITIILQPADILTEP